MTTISRAIVMNDVSIKINTNLSIDEIQNKFIYYILNNGFLYNISEEELRSNINENGIITSDDGIFFSNGCDDIIYGILFQAFCVQENIEITDFEY